MERILIIGKSGEELTGVNDFLRSFFKVMVCTETTQNAPSILKVVEPDLVVAMLAGVYDVDISIFNVLCDEFPDMPLLAIGTPSEFGNFVSVFENNNFENLMPPIDNEDILLAICRRLDLPVPEHSTTNKYKEINKYSLSNKRKILVVDDNAMTLRSIKAMLDNDYIVTIANSGMKALTAIGKERPDLILLDYEMPICDGRQTLEMIRADEEMCDIPVIFLTGVNDREHVEAVLKLKPSGYLLKPAVRKSLIEAIEKEFPD